MEKVFKHERFGEMRISFSNGFAILTMKDIMIQESFAEEFMDWFTSGILPELNPRVYGDNNVSQENKGKPYIDITQEQYMDLTGYFTIRDWCHNTNIEIAAQRQAKRMGVNATAISRKKGYTIYRIEDDRYGTINAYSEKALRELKPYK